MADPTALRRSAIDVHAPTGSEATAIVTPLPFATRFVLRVAPEAAAKAGTVAGFDLGGAINTVKGGDRLAVRLGPNEWLLIGPAGAGEALAAEIAAGLGDAFHSLVDISHRHGALGLSGAAVADVLNAGCPLDLSDAAFPAGSAGRTVLGKAEIVLIRPADGSWRVESWRSFSPYVFAFLAEAAR